MYRMSLVGSNIQPHKNAFPVSKVLNRIRVYISTNGDLIEWYLFIFDDKEFIESFLLYEQIFLQIRLLQ